MSPQRSLSDLQTFVPDAFASLVAQPFTPENIELGEYTFLPWVRTGIAAGITNPAAGAVRAEVAVSIQLQDDARGVVPRSEKTLTVRGPGDVLGFDLAQVVRRYPVPGTPNAEDTFLVHAEFDRPDFPWLFTPFAPANDRLPPWLALVVLRQSNAFIESGAPGLPQVVRTRLGELQPLDDSWAWAHAQVIGGTAKGPSVADRLTPAYGPVNLSRLLCPKRLSPNVGYVACIVPAFDVGARVGLGQPGGTLGPAWTRAAGDDNNEISLPVYDHWAFGTASDGDFQTLATKLDPIPAPWNVGRRTIDVSRPGGGIADLAAGDPGQVQVLRCALTAPLATVPPPGAPDESSAWSAAKTEELRTQLNLPAALARQFVVGGPDDLPIVGPRIYARFQRAQNTVDGVPPGDWFDEINLEPARRVVAGLGTRVVQKDREQLMQAAWAQVGAIEAANRDIRRAQAARFIGASLHARHLSALPTGPLVQLTRGVQGKLRLDPGTLTLLGAAARSATAPAALTGAFRRVTRPRGPLARYIDAPARAALQRLAAIGAAMRDHRRDYVEPDGVKTLSAAAVAGIDPQVAAHVLGVSVAAAPAVFADRVARYNALPTAADLLLAPTATWRPTATTFDLGSIGAGTALKAAHAAMPASVTRQPSRADSVAMVLTGIANSHVAGAASAAESVRNVATRLPVLARGVFRAEAGADAARAVPPSRARYDSTTSRTLALTLSSSRTVQSDVLVAALSQVVNDIGVLALAPTPPRPPLVVARATLLDAVHPRATVTAHVLGRMAARPGWLPDDWFHDGLVRPIMAAPVFVRPMYEALDDYDRQWLVPGLDRIVEKDFVTLLETNPPFTEAFLAGLSDWMGRELLWRGYPTDQRGTYFRRFWTHDRDELGQDLHRFTRTPLGTHLAVGGATGRLVFVVRGELIRRYPDATILALRALGPDPVTGHPIFIDPTTTNQIVIAPILFHAPLAPDIMLVGFDLTDADLVPGRWWFVIAEHPTAPRFGFDNAPQQLGAHAGRVAHDWLHEPFRAAYEAAKLVTSARGGP